MDIVDTSGRGRARTRTTLAVTVGLILGLVASTGPPATAGAIDDPAFRVSIFPLVDLPGGELPYRQRWTPVLPPDWQPTDADGINMAEIEGRLYYHPVRLADRLTKLVAAHRRTGDDRYLAWARKYANKVREVGIRSDGAVFVPYEFDWPRHDVHAPWFSGMAQGMLLMAFVRLYERTHDHRDLRTADELFDSVRRAGPEPRPWVSRVSDYGYLWIEEYPHDRWHDRVLNGFIFAIYGLYDYWRVTRRPIARRYLEGSLTTLKGLVMEFRVPGDISYYCLQHRVQLAKYHAVHIKQLGFVAALSGDAYFQQVADLMAGDYPLATYPGPALFGHP